MGFQHGLSGLSAASVNLDVIGNNISNANTAGFKQSQAQFTDVFANSLNEEGTTQVGIGSKVSTIAQEFSQGNISPTSNPLDIAINGQGFFRMNENGVISYSRSGQFRVDNNSMLTDASGANVTGYMADTDGTIVANQPVNLKLSNADLAPQVTSAVTLGVNLDSREAIPVPLLTFDANNPQTYQRTTSGSIVDSLGNTHLLSVYFQKTAANTWDTYATVDGSTTAAGVPVGFPAGSLQTITFDGKGALLTPVTTIPLSLDLTAIDPLLGADSPLDFTFDLTGSTQFGADFGVNSISQNGYPSGRLAGFTTSADGVIQGTYSNGQTRNLAQIVLANFANPQGLSSIGDGRWIETSASGSPLVGAPKSGTLGALQASAIEESNVDLTTELVKMIAAQRMYQANAKSIETQNTISQTIINL